MPKRKSPPRSKKSDELPPAEGLIKRNANLFVIGDLLIDHTAFVSDVTQSFPVPVTGENAYQVRHRLDTAGGAATTARTIDALTDGTTFLWGLVGNSPWGTFRSILENSQALDGTKSRIELRGARDETDASMTTISRLVAIQHTDAGRERYTRKARFVDFGQLHVPLDRQINAIRYHLDRVHRIKAPLDAIVLNDLDMSALRAEVVADIAQFGEMHQIPIVVRARRGGLKYTQLRAAALVCTLHEWRQFVSSDREPSYWSANIEKPEVAEEFARQTLSVFHSVDRFVFLVGDDWIDQIIILEQNASGGPGSLIVRSGLPEADKGKSQQVGASDVFTGALALAMVNSEEKPPRFATAVRFARNVAMEYQKTSWHRVPSRDLLALGNRDDADDGKVITARQFGTRYLPPDRTIDLSQAATCIPIILSVTKSFKTLLDDLGKAVTHDDKSIVLVAAGGSGKTEISKYLIQIAREAGLEACDLKQLGVSWSWSAPDKTVRAIKKAAATRSDNLPFVVVDEALKLTGASTIATQGVVLLNRAKDEGIRLLLIDADFAKIDASKIRSQFLRRVLWQTLPSAWERASDVPYVFCAMLREHVPNRGIPISIKASALVAIIEWLIHERQNFGQLNTLAKDVIVAKKDSEHICVCWDDLPKNIRGAYPPYQTAKADEYVIKVD